MVDGSPEGADPAFSAVEREALRPLREHRAFIIVFILSAMLSALALTYIYSQRYWAQATIFFKPSDVTQLRTHTTEALGSPFPTPSFRNITQTIDGLVSSDTLLRRVVTDLHLDAKEPRDYSGPWYVRYFKELKYALGDYAEEAWMLLRWGRLIEESPVAKAIVDLRKRIKVQNLDSYVYTLQVTQSTPERAAAVADDVGIALIDLLLRDDRRSSDKRIGDLAALRDDKNREIESIETKLRDLLARSQIASIKDEIEKATDRSSQLQKERSDTMADLRQSNAKVAALAGNLRLPGPPALARDDDPPATRRASRTGAEDYAKLTSKKLDAEVDSGGLRARLDSIDRSYAALVPHLQLLNQVQAEYNLLSVQLTSAKRDYAAVTDAFEETAIKNTSAQSELHIQAKAETPEVPVSPIKIYHVGAAGFLAALIAIGLANVLDYFQIRLFLPPAGGRRRRGLTREARARAYT